MGGWRRIQIICSQHGARHCLWCTNLPQLARDMGAVTHHRLSDWPSGQEELNDSPGTKLFMVPGRH